MLGSAQILGRNYGNDHAAYVYAAPTTGQTVIIPDGMTFAICEPSGPLNALTIQLPTAGPLYDGLIVGFSCTQVITTLTVTATAGTVVAGSYSGLTAGQGTGYICVGSTAKWYRIY